VVIKHRKKLSPDQVMTSHQIKMAAIEAAARWKHTAATKMYTAATEMSEARTQYKMPSAHSVTAPGHTDGSHVQLWLYLEL
jgi:hypothetical protein